MEDPFEAKIQELEDLRERIRKPLGELEEILAACRKPDVTSIKDQVVSTSLKKIGGPKIQPQLTKEGFLQLSELSSLPEFGGNRAAVVRTAIEDLHRSRFGSKE